MKFVPQPAIDPAERSEDVSRRRQSRFGYVLLFCFLVLFGAVVLTLDHRYFKPVRELVHIPGTYFYHLEENRRPSVPFITHHVNSIGFHDAVITADRLQPVRELPNLWNVSFLPCCRAGCDRFPGNSLSGIAHPVSEVPHFAGNFAALAKFPVLDSIEFEDCKMDVGKFVTEARNLRR